MCLVCNSLILKPGSQSRPDPRTAFSLIPNQDIKDEIHRLQTSRENEATKDGIDEKLGSMVKIGGWIEKKTVEEELGKAVPPKHKKVEKIGETLEVLLK